MEQKVKSLMTLGETLRKLAPIVSYATLNTIAFIIIAKTEPPFTTMAVIAFAVQTVVITIAITIISVFSITHKSHEAKLVVNNTHEDE